MGDKSAIEWTDASWNPVTGCHKISEGCKFCYAERITERWGQPFTKIVLHDDRLRQPLQWKRPRRIFVNSMSDLFHGEISAHFIGGVFNVMAQAPRHTFQILTKRPKAMCNFVTEYTQIFLHERPLPNVWLGVSVENQARADERILWLLKTPAAIRFLSIEPLLGPVDLDFIGPLGQSFSALGCKPCNWQQNTATAQSGPHTCFEKPPKVNWVITGGESGGPPERALVYRDHGEYVPFAHGLEWVRAIRDQCVAAGVPFFFKQWGGATPKSGGRTLDGKIWDEYPAV